MINSRALPAALAVGVALSLLLVACDGTTPTPTSTPASTPTASASATSATPTSTASTPTGTPTAPPVAGVAVPATWEPDSLSPVAMSAPSAEVVWAALQSMDGPGLFRSTDRGATWVSRGLPPGVKSPAPAFVGDREGWLAAEGAASTRCPDATLALWHTADGGDAWNRVPAADATGSLCFGSVSFLDATHGFIGVRRQGAVPGLYRTTDAGATWAEVKPLPLEASANDVGVETVRAFGGTLLLITGPVRAQGTQGKRAVLRSTDGGETWARIAEADVSLGLATAERWIVLGGPGGSVVTTDAGKTWQPLDTDYSQASPVPPVVLFGSPQVGYATTRSTITRTTDGGVHWTRVPTPGRAP